MGRKKAQADQCIDQCITKENIKNILDDPFCRRCYNSLSEADIHYKMTYPALLAVGKICKQTPNIDNIKILALATYGWMPTILDSMGYTNETEIDAYEKKVVNDVRKAIERDVVQSNDLKNLTKFINNSYVGLSKFLHFLRPDLYAIWDSNVYCALKFAYIDLPKPKELERLNNALDSVHNADGAQEYDELIEHIRTEYCIAANKVNNQTNFKAYENAIRSCKIPDKLKSEFETAAGNLGSSQLSQLRFIETRLFCVGKWLSGLAGRLEKEYKKSPRGQRPDDNYLRNRYTIFQDKIRKLQSDINQ